MILVVVGSSTIPFDRLIRAVDALPGEEEVVVQRGASRLVPERGTSVDFMPFDAIVDNVRRARAVVTHAGVGTILVSLMEGRRPIVMPRLKRYSEAVDDHQLELGRRLAEEGLVTLIEDASELAAAVADAVGGPPRALGGDGRLAGELRARIRARVGDASPGAQ